MSTSLKLIIIYNKPGVLSNNVMSDILRTVHFTKLMQCKKEGKDQESIQSSTTPDPGCQWESDNVTIRHHKKVDAQSLSYNGSVLAWVIYFNTVLYVGLIS